MNGWNEAIVRMLWTQLWQLTLVILVIAVIVRLACRQRPHLAYVLWIAVIVLFAAAHAWHLRADFPNFSPWEDWSKYTDEGWYGDAAIRHFQRGHWYVPGDFNPAAALPVWPLLESVVFLFAEREPSRLEELTELTEQNLTGLTDAPARALLASAVGAPIDQRVVARILAETRGNPLALLELPRGLTSAALAGGFGLLEDGSLPARIEASFRSRVQEVPVTTQRLLLLAAADPTGEGTV